MRLKPQTQREQGMAAVVILSIALGVVYHMYVYSPKAAELALVEAHVAALDTANQRAKVELAKGTVDQLRAQAAKQEASLDVMRQLVPTSNEVPSLLEQVSTAARRVNLDVSTVQPEPVIAGEEFDTYRYRMSVIGGYHAIGEFLGNLGSLTRIVVPTNVHLNAESDVTRTKPGEALVRSEFEIQTYIARPATAAASVTRGGEIDRESDR
jgi:type IV pilus assembly protein PilO